MKTRLSDFHFFITTMSEAFENISIGSLEGKCLSVKCSMPYFTVGLIQSPLLLKKIFELTDQNIYIHTESSLGCLQHGSMHFIFKVQSFVFCVQENMIATWPSLNLKSPNTFRVPPFPIVENNIINHELLKNLNFLEQSLNVSLVEKINAILKKIDIFKNQLKKILITDSELGTKDLATSYLAKCKDEAFYKIKQKQYSTCNATLTTKNNDVLKLKLSTDELGVKVQFSGTPSSENIFLTDLYTDGICFHLLSQYFQFGHKMNQATLDLFQISKPLNSMVYSKGSQYNITSEILGQELIKSVIHQCLWNMYGVKQTYPHNNFDLWVQFKSPKNNQALNFRWMNNKSYYVETQTKNDSKIYIDGSHLPSLADFRKVGIEILSLKERNETSDFTAWELELKTTEDLEMIYFSDYILNSVGSDNKNFKFSGKKTSFLKINGRKSEPCFSEILVAANSTLELLSGTDYPRSER